MGLFGTKPTGQSQPTTNYVAPTENTPPVTSTAPKTQAELVSKVKDSFALKAEIAEDRTAIEKLKVQASEIQKEIDARHSSLSRIEAAKQKVLALKAASQKGTED